MVRGLDGPPLVLDVGDGAGAGAARPPVRHLVVAQPLLVALFVAEEINDGVVAVVDARVVVQLVAAHLVARRRRRRTRRPTSAVRGDGARLLQVRPAKTANYLHAYTDKKYYSALMFTAAVV